MSISRRGFLKSVTWGTIAAAGPAVLVTTLARKSLAQRPPTGTAPASQSGTAPASPMDKKSSSDNAGFYRFKLGTFTCISLSDGILKPPAKAFAGNVPEAELKATLQEGFTSEMLDIDCNILYVNTGKNQVLIDVGSGLLNGPTGGKLLKTMAAAGLRPADIDTILISHAHGDHVGGFGKFPAQVFPKARYYISQPEWTFWMGDSPSLPKIPGGPEMLKTMAATAKQQLKTIEKKVTQFGVEQEVIPGITSISAPGHTPGHVAFRLQSGDASLIHTADTVHVATINLWHPEWQPVFDGDPDLAVKSRKAVLSKIERDRTLMFAYHFPFPGLGHLRSRSGGGYQWQPVQWLTEVS
jgi:glyoxylase-like metal-dependent hydrolase (beta-lactamase superfamily II)